MLVSKKKYNEAEAKIDKLTKRNNHLIWQLKTANNRILSLNGDIKLLSQTLLSEKAKNK